LNKQETTPLLEMKGISKRFAGVQALQNVDITVYPQEVLAIIGENGAGKSTLMNILGGVHIPDTGDILIEGKSVQFRSVSDSIHHGIGFIHQELNILDNLDVAGNVFLGREPVKGPLKLMDRKHMREMTQPYLDKLGLHVTPDQPLQHLSIALQQMVEIAKALSLQARILIMDEPTSSLTMAETEKLMTVIKDLRSNGVSIIYISHRLGEIEGIADRVVALRDGKNAGNLSKEEIDHDRMVHLMVGRDLDKTRVLRSPRETSPCFEVQSLRTQRYPDHNVTLKVDKGEIVGMAGLVGAGRSEVARAIFGVDPGLNMHLSLDGKEIHVRSPKDAIRHGIYLVPEDRRGAGLILEMTIRENITLPALESYASGGLIKRDRETTAAQSAVRTLNVKTPSVEFPVGNLSGGNQQKVVLARWLALDPKLLIFDEPTRGIDVGAKAEIYELMRNLASHGVAILMISSDMEEVLLMSDRVIVMHEGHISGVLSQDECKEENIMQLAVGNIKSFIKNRKAEKE
jgi:ribose transport system ATP-binding protein